MRQRGQVGMAPVLKHARVLVNQLRVVFLVGDNGDPAGGMGV